MRRTLALICSVLAVPALAAGCGGDDDASGGDTGAGGGGKAVPTEQAPEAGSLGSREEGQKTAEVALKDISFKPATVNVAKGGTVRWTNEEAVPHDVTYKSGPAKKFSSGNANLNKGDTYEQTFSKPGKIQYVCTVHPGMSGTVVVK